MGNTVKNNFAGDILITAFFFSFFFLSRNFAERISAPVNFIVAYGESESKGKGNQWKGEHPLFNFLIGKDKRILLEEKFGILSSGMKFQHAP